MDGLISSQTIALRRHLGLGEQEACPNLGSHQRYNPYFLLSVLQRVVQDASWPPVVSRLIAASIELLSALECPAWDTI